ncbi:MAG: hypothetical protein K9W42_00985 [Candidatus Heimdallarchaeota archaeon]|nr:hypothetical protein [Candidatus Heimdallarchaeota archaeon]
MTKTRVVTTVAYPTIPIVFLGGINSDRTPLYDTMGLAVTTPNETTRTETTIQYTPTLKGTTVKFFLNGTEITGLRGRQIIDSIKKFVAKSQHTGDLIIQSKNIDIFSGSSDSGLAALYTGLNAALDLHYPKEKLLLHAMKGSESAGRSLFGGLTLTKVQSRPLTVEQIASAEELEAIKLFSVPFHYPSRLSADEIHAGIVTNPNFPKRVKRIPDWVSKIVSAARKRDFITMLTLAEENIKNAHELLEGVNLFVRKPEMMRLCHQLEAMRERGIMAYYLIGGGNLITVATTAEFAGQVAKELQTKGWSFHPYKVAGPPKILANSVSTV